jgi:integrase
MLAAYGLRPHEIFHLNTSELEQGGMVVKVLAPTKTGYREVLPLHPEWIEQFNLRQKRLPKVTGKCNRDLGGRVAPTFRRYKIPFPPYHLRHCYAVRCIRFNIPVSLAARWMGHAVATHTQTYQAWLSKAIEREMFEQAINSPTRPQAPQLRATDLAA